MMTGGSPTHHPHQQLKEDQRIPDASIGATNCVEITNTNSASETPRARFHFSQLPSLEQLRTMQAEFCEERNWDQFHQPRNLLLAMVGEVGEVAELFQWRGEVKEGLPDWSPEEKMHLSHELSDVLIYLIRLADKCHIDLPHAAMEKIALNGQKYPACKVYGSSRKYTDYQDGH